MAKLKGPLFSLGAAQQLGKALVYFPWKGLDLVREYVVPANPRTTLQQAQRAHMTAAVTAIHAAQARPTLSLGPVDVTAYALWASIFATPRTWFNMAVKAWIDMGVLGWQGAVYRGGTCTGGALKLDIVVYSETIKAGGITAGNFYYGTSKTALINITAATIDTPTNKAIKAITGLGASTKYYVQFRPTAVGTTVGANSGIYHATTD